MDSDKTMRDEIDALRRQVGWLLDKEAIRNTKQLYCRLADNGRYDEFETIFTEDFTCEINGPPNADGSTPMLLYFPTRDAWIAFTRENGAKRQAVDLSGGREGPQPPEGRRQPGSPGWHPGAAHHMHGGEIEFTGPDSARAIWPSQFDGANGYYDEEYRRVGNEWKIARERFFAQARREYRDGDYPYALELGSAARGGRRAEAINYGERG